MPAFRTRAVMLDPARVMERKDYYRDLLPWLKAWGYNTLHFHITDDQGSALAFPSHPELAKDGAFTADEMADFVREAKGHRIAVVPELESLGHTRFITSLPRYKRLGGRGKRSGFNAIDPDRKETRKLLQELLEDTATLFPAEVLHVGLDEVNLSGLPQYKTLPEEEVWKPFAKHAAWVHRTVRKLGRRPAMWGDHCLSAPKMLGRYDKDVILVDWHYHATVDASTPLVFLDKGFDVWTAPAVSQWGETRGLPNAANIENIRRFAGLSLQLRKRGVIGMTNTVWCPWRYLPGGADYPMALGGHLFEAREEDPGFAADFAREFYGLNKADGRRAGALIHRLHMTAPRRRQVEHIMNGGSRVNPFTREDVRACRELARNMGELRKALKPFPNKARRHAERLGDLVLSAELYERMGVYGAAGRKTTALRSVKTFLKRCVAAWKRDRHECTRKWLHTRDLHCVLGLARRLSPGR